MRSLPAHHGGRRARKKEGLPTSGRPWTAPFCLQEHVGSVSFSKSQTAVGRENIFLGFVFQDTTPELSEKSLDARGAGPGRQRRGISGVSGTGAPTPPGTCGRFLFLTCHTQCPPSYREPGAEPARRGGRRPHPAKGRLTCSRGRRRQAGRQGEAGATGRATRETGRREGPRLGRRGGRSPGYSLLGARGPEPSCHALDVRGSGRLLLGASRVL